MDAGRFVHRHLGRLGRPKPVPSKAYSGLTDLNTKWTICQTKYQERFGPVRTVKPDWYLKSPSSIQESPRHKSGIRPDLRIQRWRKDKPKEEANTLEDLKALLSQ